MPIQAQYGRESRDAVQLIVQALTMSPNILIAVVWTPIDYFLLREVSDRRCVVLLFDWCWMGNESSQRVRGGASQPLSAAGASYCTWSRC